MAVPCLLDPELKVCAAYSSVSFSRKAINHSCVSSFHQNPAFTLPVTEGFFAFLFFICLFFISGTLLSFNTSNFKDSWGADLHCSSRGWSCQAFVICWAHPGKVVTQLYGSSQFMANQAERRYQDSLFSASFWSPVPGNSVRLRYHPFFLQPRGSSDHGVTLGFHPTSSPEHL